MKKGEMPTIAQAVYIRDTAIDLGVTREMFQTLRDDGTWTKVLKKRREQILADRDNCRFFELKARVRQGRLYIEALEAGGPDTPSEYDVRKVGVLYPPVSNQEEEVEFILLNFPKGGGSWDKALAWAKSKDYKITNPREAFAVAEQNDLLELLGCNWFCLFATIECSFEGDRLAVCVDVFGSSRDANLRRVKCLGDNSGWFLFRK